MLCSKSTHISLLLADLQNPHDQNDGAPQDGSLQHHGKKVGRSSTITPNPQSGHVPCGYCSVCKGLDPGKATTSTVSLPLAIAGWRAWNSRLQAVGELKQRAQFQQYQDTATTSENPTMPTPLGEERSRPPRRSRPLSPQDASLCRTCP